MADIEIEIDGKKLTAKPDQMVIQAADEAGIYIPRFCYHKHLSIAANCRMCLVEVEKAPKPLPACATPVMPGMKVFTKSAKTIEAQRSVMEFLLINHPLDCPICDQGGECELQDLSMGYGASASSYDECKRAQPDLDLGPLISTEMTRCIFCTRCVRFGAEIAGMREMGGTFRGEQSEIGTFVKHAMHSEVSGNIIDLCPVGALTSKPYRFTARAWELQQAPSIAPHDCLGSHVNVHTLNGIVKRVVARENQDINLTWLSDRDRFGYTGLYHADRLSEPMIRSHGQWIKTDWQHAFEVTVQGLQTVLNQSGADSLGALISPSATVEECYLLQKLMRALGSPHIDHRLRETDTRDQASLPLMPGFGMPIADIENSKNILLVGSNVQKEQPLLAIRLRAAVKRGATVSVINPVDYDFNFDVSSKQIIAPHRMIEVLAALNREANSSMHIILGALAMHHPEASLIRSLANEIAASTGGIVSYLTDGANSAGAWFAGAIPHRQVGGAIVQPVGLSAKEMLASPRKGYILLNVEPDKDIANPAEAVEAIKQAAFVVALCLYRNAVIEEHADVILPMAAFTETAGTFINAAGHWQHFTGVASAFGSARPAWKILRVLGNFLHLDGFGYESVEEITHEVKSHLDKASSFTPSAFSSPVVDKKIKTDMLSRIGEIPIYAVDSLVRHAEPLQAAQVVMEGNVAIIRMNAKTAKQAGLTAGDNVRVSQQSFFADLPWMLDERVPAGAVWIAGGIAETASLGGLFGEVTVSRVTHAG